MLSLLDNAELNQQHEQCPQRTKDGEERHGEKDKDGGGKEQEKCSDVPRTHLVTAKGDAAEEED